MGGFSESPRAFWELAKDLSHKFSPLKRQLQLRGIKWRCCWAVCVKEFSLNIPGPIPSVNRAGGSGTDSLRLEA